MRMNQKGGRSAADYTEVERSKGSKAGEGSRDRDHFKPPPVGPCRSPCTPGGKSWNMELALWSSREFRRCGSHDRQVRGGAAAAGRRDLAGRDHRPTPSPRSRSPLCLAGCWSGQPAWARASVVRDLASPFGTCCGREGQALDGDPPPPGKLWQETEQLGALDACFRRVASAQH